MKKIDGFISIFLALIILPIYSFAILTIDIVKVMTAKNDTRLANEVVLESTLANYDRNLYDKYGVFGIDKTEEYLEEYIKYMISNNVDNDKTKFYNITLDNVDLTVSDKSLLVNPVNLEKQILDYMEFKGPYILSKGFMNLLDLVKSSKNYTKVLEKKMDFEEEYSKLNANFEDITKYFINYSQNFEQINNSYSFVDKKLKEIINDFNKILEIKQIDVNNEENEKAIVNIKDKINSYNTDNQKLEKLMIQQQININDIISTLEKFYSQTINLDRKLKEWGNAIDSLENTDIKNNFDSEYKTTKSKFTKENIKTLLNKIKSHKNTLSENLETMKSSKTFYIEYSTLNKNLKFDITKMNKLPSLNNFKIYKYIMDQKEKNKVESSEKKIAKENKKNLEDLSNKFDDVKSVDDFGNISDYINLSEFSKDKYFNNSTNIFDYSKNYKDAIKQSDSIIKLNETNLIDNLYISLYLIEKFNSKFDNNSEFLSQLEYILFGNENLNKNISSVENSIFSIRLLLNSIYAYTNSDLGREATAIASAIAGWTGFGVPIIRTAILGTMSISESILDVNTINKNKYLEAFKNKSSWKVSIQGIPNLLNKQLKEVTSDTIGNIYKELENATNKGVDYVNNKVDEFVKQTIDGVSQTIISEFISPIQVLITNHINNPITNIKDSLIEIIDRLESNINNYEEFNNIRNQVLSYIREKILKEYESINSLNFETYFRDLTTSVENIVKDYTKNISDEFKSNLNKYLYDKSVESKIKINEIIDEYTKNLSANNNIRGSKSGISFNYKDYLTLIAFFRVNVDKENILNRMATVIDYEMKKINPEFNIMRVITNIEFTTNMEVDVSLLSKYIKLKRISESIQGGF